MFKLTMSLLLSFAFVSQAAFAGGGVSYEVISEETIVLCEGGKAKLVRQVVAIDDGAYGTDFLEYVLKVFVDGNEYKMQFDHSTARNMFMDRDDLKGIKTNRYHIQFSEKSGEWMSGVAEVQDLYFNGQPGSLKLWSEESEVIFNVTIQSCFPN